LENYIRKKFYNIGLRGQEVVDEPYEDSSSQGMVMDASYSFSYDNDIAARQESAGKWALKLVSFKEVLKL
jgi:hypothetical protein